jgi:hypothetical protein
MCEATNLYRELLKPLLRYPVMPGTFAGRGAGRSAGRSCRAARYQARNDRCTSLYFALSLRRRIGNDGH